MQLSKITTKNFKKLRHFEATFTGGLNVIVGDNAQGKSTLLQAIECALYGPTVVPGRKDDIVTWGQKGWSVELVFCTGEDVYTLTRTKSTAKLERESNDDPEAGPQLVANGNTPVTEAVCDIVGMSSKDYNLFMQSKQGETSGVLTFGAAALNRKVEEWAGISLIDRVQGMAQEEHRVYKAGSEALAVAPEDLKEAEERVEETAVAYSAAEGELAEATEAFGAVPGIETLQKPEQDPEELQRLRDKVTRLQHRAEKAQQEADYARQKRDEAQQRLDEADEPKAVDALQAEVDRLKNEGRQAAAEVSRFQEKLTKVQQLFQQLQQAELEFDRHPPEEEIEEALAEEEEKQKAHYRKRDEAHDQVVQLGQKIKQLQSLRKDADCPTCGTRLSEHDPEKLAEEIRQLAEDRDKLEGEREEAAGYCKAADNSVRELQRGLEAAQAAERKVDSLRDEIVDMGLDTLTGDAPLKEKLDAAREVHHGVLSGLANAENQLEQSEREQEKYRRLRKAVDSAVAQYEDAVDSRDQSKSAEQEARAEGEPTDADIAAARDAWSKYEADKKALEAKLSESRHAMGMAEMAEKQASDAVHNAQAALSKLQDSQARSLADAKKADQAGRLSKFLRESRQGYLQEVWDAVLGAASKQVALASQGMITAISYVDGEFRYEEEGVTAPVTSASGAQKAHIGVAVRIGLARALYGNAALLIFDEPTESMREHHAIGLSASLASAAQQTLLITHREQDQDLASNVVEVG